MHVKIFRELTGSSGGNLDPDLNAVLSTDELPIAVSTPESLGTVTYQ